MMISGRAHISYVAFKKNLYVFEILSTALDVASLQCIQGRT